MKRKCVAVLGLLTCALVIAGCGGGGGETTVDEQLETASTYLTGGDIASARDAYSAIIGDGRAITAAKTVDPDNSEARFGRALCDMILLIEKDPSTAILAGFGQSSWGTSSAFGATGYLALSLTDPTPVYPSLPFYNVRDCWHGRAHHHSHRCALIATADNYTVQDIAASLNELMVYVDDIIEDLLVAVNDTSAAFTVPKGLHSGDADIPVNHADMQQILAGMYMLKAASDFANSWTFNIDLSALVDENGESLMTVAELVNQLNEQFALRADNRLASARTNMQSWATHSKSALEEVLGGSSGGVLNLSSENQSIYNDLYELVSSVNDSFSGATQLDQLLPIVETNLDNFFDNPADGADIPLDPFVVEGGKIKAVEAYWQQMINTACDYNIGTFISIFSNATRAISRPYYQLFNTIMGHTFGEHRAGRGA